MAKAGDKVKCIRGNKTLIEGIIYKVVNAYSDGYNTYYSIEGLIESGGYYQDRFVDVDQEESTTIQSDIPPTDEVIPEKESPKPTLGDTCVVCGYLNDKAVKVCKYCGTKK